MEFGLSPDQAMLQDGIDRVLRDVSGIEAVREAIARESRHDAAIGTAVADLGLPAMLVPKRFGGMGLPLLDAALAAEKLGAHITPVPFVGAYALAPLALLGAGSEEQQVHWLPKIAAGKALIGVGITEHAAGVRDGAGLSLTDGRLSGTARCVLDCNEADAYIVADRAGALHLIPAEAPGLSVAPLKLIDRTRPFGDLIFDNTPADPLVGGDTAKTLARMTEAGRILLAADTLGAGWAMIDQAVAYALERKQFDRVIGSFQAVKHLCAEMAAELEPCRSLIWYAAHSFDEKPEDCAVMAGHAKSLTDEVGRFVARTTTEVHGGMGFTDLLGLHFWFKRIGVNRQLLGGPERVRTELGELISCISDEVVTLNR